MFASEALSVEKKGGKILWLPFKIVDTEENVLNEIVF